MTAQYRTHPKRRDDARRPSLPAPGSRFRIIVTTSEHTPSLWTGANPFERPVEKIVWDVKNGLVSITGAREDYGVVITNPQTLSVDLAETERLRSAALARAHHVSA